MPIRPFTKRHQFLIPTQQSINSKGLATRSSRRLVPPPALPMVLTNLLFRMRREWIITAPTTALPLSGKLLCTRGSNNFTLTLGTLFKALNFRGTCFLHRCGPMMQPRFPMPMHHQSGEFPQTRTQFPNRNQRKGHQLERSRSLFLVMNKKAKSEVNGTFSQFWIRKMDHYVHLNPFIHGSIPFSIID